LDERIIPEFLDAVARLSRETDARIFLVSNQGQQWIPLKEQEAVMRHLVDPVEERGGRIDAVYICTNDKKWTPPEGEENGRKPAPGMLLAAAIDNGDAVDLADSYMVGDMTTDIAAGESAHPDVTSVLVKTGYGGKDGKVKIEPDHTSADLGAAVDWIISRTNQGSAQPTPPQI